MGAARAAGFAWAVLAAALSMQACVERSPTAAGERSRGASAPSSAPSVASPPALPRLDFVGPRAWQSTHASGSRVEPPDIARERWRALASQTEPMQVKAPRWQALPPDRSVELAMPQGSRFRCLVSPLRVTPQANDFGSELTAWNLERTLLCSSDGFRSWTEQPHVVTARTDGTREVAAQGGALLRQRDEHGREHLSYVMLRADAEQRVATTGPPQVLPGVLVAED